MTLEKKTDALTLYFPSPTLIRPHLGITSYCAFVVKSAKLRSGSVRSEFRSRSISVLDFSYLESPEFIGVQGLLRVKKKKRALLRIPVMRVLRISNMYPARAPSILPSPVPAHVPAASGRWLLPLGTWGLAARPGRLRAVGVAPAWLLLFLPCALLLALRVRPNFVSHGHGPGLLDHDQRSPVPSNGTL